ncbi:MAG: helix-turn-helix domain-containing protein, partial [Cyanobacteria bacterium P01_A01_bin.40]
EEPPDEDTIKSHIRRLRKKLTNAGAANNFIETVYGMGYRLQQNL